MEQKKVIVLKYSEIHLKGGNRKFFEKALLKNLKYKMYKLAKVTHTGSRYIVHDFDESNLEEIESKIMQTFGVHSYSIGTEIETSYENVKEFCASIKLSGTFKVDTTRADKTFPVNSMDLSREIGGIILKNNSGLEVDVRNPQTLVKIDIRENGYTYIYMGEKKALGGLPVGTSSKGLVLLSGGIDSPVCAVEMAKRGMEIMAIHFHSFPYTSEQAKQKVIDLAKLVKPYTNLNTLFVVPFTKIQEAIHKNCNEEYMITLMRRFMMRISERIANSNECGCLITGENLGQVASQTIESMTITNNAIEYLPVMRPLVSRDKEEIIEIAKKIGTFETSILPYEDCCTVFLPKYPIIKPKLEKVLKEESNLNIEDLVNEAIENVEVVRI